MKLLRYYISGHGLGHASRSCQIINTLRSRHPELAVQVVSDAHPWFFQGALDPSVPVRRRTLDIGVVQQDSLVMQVAKTLQVYRELLRGKERIVAEEAASMKDEGVSLVVADIPALAFAAAARAGVRSLGISNFTWDWIYQGLVKDHRGVEDVLQSLAADYAQADRMLSLPFAGEFPAIATVEQLPLVARKGSVSPEEIRGPLQIPDNHRLGLVSFGGFGLNRLDLEALASIEGWAFICERGTVDPIDNLRILSPGQFSYPDLVATADAVITKPGYGIVSEAIANRTAVLYTSRGEFPEQALLVAGLKRYARSRYIDNEQLRSGRWQQDLELLLTQAEPEETLRSDGDLVAADRLAEIIGDW